MEETCMYCAQDERLHKLMVPVCSLTHTNVYLYREVTFPGRCVVVLKNHIQKLTQLSPAERQGVWDNVGLVAETVTALYSPDKLNYLILGDCCPHLHVHVVPKYTGTPQWGKMFEMMPQPPRFLPDEPAYRAEADRLREALLAGQK
ncbi:MAG: HIT family protein [Oscillospiraceae bacterium]